MLITLRGSRVNSKQTNGRGRAKHKGGLGQIVQRMAFFTRPDPNFFSLLYCYVAGYLHASFYYLKVWKRL